MKLSFGVQKSFFFLLISTLSFAGCKSLDPSLSPPLLPIPTAYSSVQVPVKVPTEVLENLLNQRIPPILFEDKGLSLGNGVIGDLQFAKNGAIRIEAVDSVHFQVSLPIRIKGEVGLKPGGLRNLFQTKIPIDQTFAPVFLIDPKVNSNWSLGVSSFELLDLGGKTSLSVLGVNLDLSQLIRKEIRDYAAEQLTSKPDLVQLKPLVDQAWSQVGRPVVVDFEGKKLAFSIQPDSVKISERVLPGYGYDLNLGLSGKVNSHPADAVPSRAFPLPSLSTNNSQANALDIQIPLRLSYTELDQLLQQNFSNQTIRVNRNTVFTPSNFKTRAYGEKLGIAMDFVASQTSGKEIKGELFLVGQPTYDPERGLLIFKEADFSLKSDNSKAKTAAALKHRKIVKQLNQKLQFPLGEAIEGSITGIRERLALDTPIANLSVTDLEAYPSGFFPAATGLEIQLKATGKVAIQWK